ncbi:hypothetical protein Sru01_57010 [Sphaerisporangium rufum]|uniref:Histidine kinase/HSP90-like ATPase domain-containing protein n=1 Tax=Sphaerisporangium rufum TaxID=1381558 RepID=A0A919R749_9ACTN|nr:hypothetical protein Sru01_57010 [Sphaerisporangium rufum]
MTSFLSGWPVLDAAELIVSELATNAIRHSASRRFGGRFQVMIHAQHDRVWLGVADEGGPDRPALAVPGEHEEGGRGLVLVAALAESCGVRGDEQGRTVWALMLVEPAAVGSARPDPGAESAGA